MNFKFKKVDNIPTHLRGGKTNPIIEYLESANIDQWIEITGFNSKEEIKKIVASLRSGKRSFMVRLKKEGLRMLTRSDYKNHILYIKKVNTEKE